MVTSVKPFYCKNEFPKRFHSIMDIRRWGSGERLRFGPYTKGAYFETLDWIAKRHSRGGRHGPRPLRRFGPIASGEVARRSKSLWQPGVLRTPFAVCRLMIAVGSTKRRLVIGLYQISWLPSRAVRSDSRLASIGGGAHDRRSRAFTRRQPPARIARALR
jgi:hypothetical protein